MEVFRLVGRLTLQGIKAVQQQIDQVGNKARNMGKGFEGVGETVNETMENVSEAVENATDTTEKLGETISETSETIQKSYKSASTSVNDYRRAMREAERQQQEALNPLREQLLENERAWWDLAESTKNYTGTTADFMEQVTKLGKAHKKITDQMMAQNRLALSDFYQSVGEILNLSGQSEKIAQNFERMGNPLYTFNNGLLAITGSLEALARSGAPKVLALKLLGPTASLKELQDMTKLITQGQTRFQAVLLASAVAVVGLTTALSKAAFGPDPKKVRAQMEELDQIYKDALAEREKEIYQWAGLFEQVHFAVPNPDFLIQELNDQVNIMKNWMENLGELTRRGLDEGFLKELEEMGPEAAGYVESMTRMSDAELTEYQKLFHEKHRIAKEQSLSELEELRIQTQEQIQKLADSLEPLGLAVEEFEQTWGKALEPFVESFGKVATKVVEMGTAVGEFVNKLNEVNPMISTAIGWFIFLSTVLTLLLSPLAVGIGLVGGFAAAWASVWPFISPLILGLGAMSGTIFLVTSAILLAVGAITLIVNAFENWVNGSEEARTTWDNFVKNLKDGADRFLTPLKDSFNEVMTNIKTVITNTLTEIQTFWNEHGTQFLTAVQNFLTVLLAIWNFVFPILKFVVEGILYGIVTIFSGFVDVVMGLVKIFTGLFTGDWALMWEGLKSVIWGAIQIIWGWLNLSFFGKIAKGIGMFVKTAFTSFKGFFTNLINNTKSFVTNIQNWFKNLQTGVINRFNQVKTLGGSIWSAITNAISKAWQTIRETVANSASRILSTAKDKFNQVKNAIMNPLNSAKTLISGWISKIKGWFSGLKLGIKLSAIKLPHFRIENWSWNPADWVKAMPKLKISWYATGGIFDGPSIVGLGERGREAILPLEGRYMQPFAEAIASQMPSNVERGGTVFEVPVYLNGREMARAIVDDVDRALSINQRIVRRGRGV